jgi:hypothetical protein
VRLETTEGSTREGCHEGTDRRRRRILDLTLHLRLGAGLALARRALRAHCRRRALHIGAARARARRTVSALTLTGAAIYNDGLLLGNAGLEHILAQIRNRRALRLQHVLAHIRDCGARRN